MYATRKKLIRRLFSRVVASALFTTWIALAFSVALSVEAGEPWHDVERSSGVIAEGTRWETPYYVVESGTPGPVVMIVGGIHGNEPAGEYAAQQILHWSIERGRMIVLPSANRPGLDANTRWLPGKPSGQRDLNRNFPAADRKETRGELATAIWELTEQVQPDWVLDLHEGYEFNISHQPPPGRSKSVGTSVIYLSCPAIDPLVDRMLDRLNATIDNEDRRFVRLSRGPVDGSWVRACLRELGCQGMILETTFKDQPISLRARQHRMLVHKVLTWLEMVDETQVDRLIDTQAAEVSVALFDGPGAGASGVNTLTRLVGEQPEMQIRRVGPEDIRDGVLDQFDVLIAPGGSGSRQGRALGEAGRTAIREFIARGGGFVGVCAGAYLCSAHYDWSLQVIDTAVFTGAREIEGVGRRQMWYRGPPTQVQMEVTEAGQEIFNSVPALADVRYHNGPIVSPANDPLLPDYTVLAYFRSENALYPPQEGTMVDTPAIVAAPFGEGRVISISPHPESTMGLKGMIPIAIRWTRQPAALPEPSTATETELEPAGPHH